MSRGECQQDIDELDSVIDDTRELIKRFLTAGMDESMPGDYQQRHDVYSRAVNDQWIYTQAMLRTSR